MPTIDNQHLYDEVKKYADKIYSKPSAYKSGFIVKTYKQRGGTYSDDKQPRNLARWYKEEWTDIGDKSYPVYRPTKRINRHTPLTEGEINNKNLKQQIALKQIIKGDYNLPKFEGKGISIPHNDKDILEYSNPTKVFKNAKRYLGDNVEIQLSTNPKKKYMVLDPHTNKWINFGQMGYQDFTKHQDPVRRNNYLNRTLFMQGDWKHNKYSPNNLSRNILWQ